MHYYFTDDLRQRVFDYLTEPVKVDDIAVARAKPVRAMPPVMLLRECLLLLPCPN